MVTYRIVRINANLESDKPISAEKGRINLSVLFIECHSQENRHCIKKLLIDANINDYNLICVPKIGFYSPEIH